MTIVVLGRSALSFSPFHSWFADTNEEIILITTESRLDLPEAEWASAQARYAEIHLHDNLDHGDVDDDLLDIASRTRISGIVALSEYDLTRAGGFREYLNIQGQQLDSARAFRDKLLMRELLAGVVAGPDYSEVTRALDLIAFIELNGYPVVLKPRRGAGAVGVQILRDGSDLDKVLAHQWVPKVEELADLIVETFVEGTLYHVDGLIVNGIVQLCWPSRYLDDPSAFLSNSRLASVLLNSEDPLVPRLRRVVADVLDAMPTSSFSSFHAEVFHTPQDTLVLGEIASRTGGGRVNDTMRHAFGTNLNRETARSQAGLPPDAITSVDEAEMLRRNGNAGWVVCYPASPGRARFHPEPSTAPIPCDLRIMTTPRLTRAVSSVDGIASAMIPGESAEDVSERIDILGSWFMAAMEWTNETENEDKQK